MTGSDDYGITSKDYNKAVNKRKKIIINTYLSEEVIPTLLKEGFFSRYQIKKGKAKKGAPVEHKNDYTDTLFG